MTAKLQSFPVGELFTGDVDRFRDYENVGMRTLFPGPAETQGATTKPGRMSLHFYSRRTMVVDSSDNLLN